MATSGLTIGHLEKSDGLPRESPSHQEKVSSEEVLHGPAGSFGWGNGDFSRCPINQWCQVLKETLENLLRPSPGLLKSLAVTGESESYVDQIRGFPAFP